MILLHKPQTHGFLGSVYDPIDDYSRNRMQIVFWEEKKIDICETYDNYTPRINFGTFVILLFIKRSTENAKNNNQIAKVAVEAGSLTTLVNIGTLKGFVHFKWVDSE